MTPLIKLSVSSISDSEISILNGEVSLSKKYLLERVSLKSTSILIVSGSLIEGIGTIHSDIDCIVMCEDRPTANDLESSDHALVTDIDYRYITGEQGVHNTTDFLGDTSIHIDADYITYGELDAIILKIEKSYRQVANDQRFLYEPVLSNTENNVIHRFLIGHALANEQAFCQLKSSIPVEKHIYLAHREKLPVFYAFQDVQGCWQSGNLWMGCEIVRDMMLKTTMSFTYLAGTTNKHYKWVYSNMFRVKGFHEIKGRFFSLSRQGSTTEKECRQYIVSTLDYMDLVFLAMEELLTKSTIYPSAQKSLRALNEEFSQRKHTHHKISRCEYFFRKKYFAAKGTPSLSSLLKQWD